MTTHDDTEAAPPSAPVPASAPSVPAPPAEVRSDRFAVEVDYDRLVYFALQQNDVPLIKALRVRNLTDAPTGPLTLRVWAEPGLASVREIPVEPLEPHASFRLGPQALPLPSNRLVNQTEREAGTLWVEVKETALATDLEGDASATETEVVLRSPRPLEVLAYGEWPGPRSLPEILAAFVLPNHPAVARVLSAAGRHLGERTQDPSLDGYQRGDPARVRQAARAIYEALVDLDLAYAVPPASFEAEGQKIRTPDAGRRREARHLPRRGGALRRGAGAGRPAPARRCSIEEHAAVGVWLNEECFVDAAVDERARLEKRIASESILFLEATGVTSHPRLTFEEAVTEGGRRVAEDDTFLYAVDVRAARRAGIRPLPARDRSKLGDGRTRRAGGGVAPLRVPSRASSAGSGSSST